MKILLTLFLFLASCAGSPDIIVHKNVTNNIVIQGEPCPIERCGSFLPVWISIDTDYTTKSELETDLKVDQQINPQTTTPGPGL